VVEPQGAKGIVFADRLGSSIFVSKEENWTAIFHFISQSKAPSQGNRKRGRIMKKVGIIMGSDSDLPVVEKAINKLRDYGVPYEVHVYSAHRTPEQAGAFARTAREEGFGVIIAAAGKAAHLAGAMAAGTTLPVIGIPVKSSTLDGMDALLSTVQMPTGIPVATVAIDGAANAAILAVEMLAIEDASLAEKLQRNRDAERDNVLKKNAGVELEYNQN
jgi:5-(carboxyamino)imidazole ribonucleotide mutase